MKSERIVDPVRIRRIVKALARYHGIDDDVESAAAWGHQASADALGGIDPVVGLPSDGGVEVAGPLAIYRLARANADAESSERWPASLPTEIECLTVRAEARVRARPGTLLRYRTLDGGSITWEIHDISARGLSFLVAARDVAPPIGETHDAEIDWQGQLRVRVRFTIRRVSEYRPASWRLVGTEMTIISLDDLEHFAERLTRLVDLNTRSGGTWTDDLWELFEDSGYFSLSNKRPNDFSHLRGAFVDSSHKLARSPDLGLQIVWPSGRGVEASLSVVAISLETAFLYHVACRRMSLATAVLYDVYQRAIRWMFARESLRWLVGWVQDAARVPKKIHLDFVRRYCDASGRDACIVVFRALEIATQAGLHPSHVRLAVQSNSADVSATEWTLRPARASELSQIAEGAAKRWPPSFLEAHGLTIAEDYKWAAWNNASLMRGRKVIVAERGGRLEAAAIIDFAENGMHLFGLFDCLRIIPLGSMSEGARIALIDHAQTVFSQLGKATFVYASDSQLSEDQWPAGAADLGLTHCFVMSTALLPQFAAHVWELFMGAWD